MESGKNTLENKRIPKPAQGKQGQSIEYYLENDVEMRKYTASGIIQRWNGDRWVFAKGTAKPSMIQTSEQAREMVNTRWDNIREDAILGIMDATGQQTPDAAYRKLTEVYASHSIAGGRGGAAYADKVIELAQLSQPKHSKSEDPLAPGTVRLTATVSIDELRRTLAGKYADNPSPSREVVSKDE